MLEEEIDQTSLIDGDQSGLILKPQTALARERGEELLQHSVIALVAFILAAVVIALVDVAFQLEDSPIGTTLYLCAFAFGKSLELLNEGRLTIAGVTTDDD